MGTATEETPTGPAPVQQIPAGLVNTETPQPVPVPVNETQHEKSHTPAEAPAQTPVQTQTMPTINTLPNPQTVTPLHLLSNPPQWIDCPFCKQRTQTRIHKEGTSMQVVAGAVCCLFCICLTCVPCLAGWFENIQYHCTQCNKMVALRPHDGPIQTFGPQSTNNQVASQYAVIQQPEPTHPPQAVPQVEPTPPPQAVPQVEPTHLPQAAPQVEPVEQSRAIDLSEPLQQPPPKYER